MQQKFANNNGLLIEYFSLNNEMSNIPLVIIPGAINGAGDNIENIAKYSNLKTIVVSLRGRGESSIPETAYSINDQLTDIESVINAEGIKEFYLFGHSVGAGIASGYTIKHPEQVKGLILGDYPPGYPNFNDEWAQKVKNNFPAISEDFVKGLVKDSEKLFFLNELAEINIKTLILKSGGSDSILSIELAQKIQTTLTNSILAVLDNCGHEMFDEDPEQVFDEVKEFMGQV